MRRKLAILGLGTLAFFLEAIGALGDAPGRELRLDSPDQSVQFKLDSGQGRLRYTVAFKGRPVIESSPLTFVIDGVEITDGCAVGEFKPYSLDETYATRGVHSHAVNRCHGATIALKHVGSKLNYSLEIRVFNDGVAFRWLIAGAEERRVPDELSRFVLPAGSTVWFHDFGGHYEGVHARKEIAEVQAGEWAAPPLTCKLPGGAGYASITEAALVHFSGMGLQADGQRGFQVALGHKHPISYPFRLRYKEDIDRVSQPAAITGPITSPWRVVMIGADLNALVNCDIVSNLSPPPDPKLFPQGADTEWIKPGRAVWRYLDGGENTLAGMKEFCRLAGELGFEYCVVEGFWQRWSAEELRELVLYAKEHRVGIWLWKHTKELRVPEARRAFFQRCHDAGAAGVKLDFFDHEAREVIELYSLLLREAAERHLMVDFHGANKPTGEVRTWPNELVREAVKGMEASKLTARARHDATLPFTRYLAGPADYTPLHFGARRGDTTWAHQVATAVVFTSPLLTFAAHPRNILSNSCAPMIRSIPATWDETLALPASEIGEIAVFARRHGETWFLAVVNGPQPRSLQIPLSFLGTGEFHALMIGDKSDNSAAVMVEEKSAGRGDSLPVVLGAGGGFVARFSPK
jgi:alpha-glucosidase